MKASLVTTLYFQVRIVGLYVSDNDCQASIDRSLYLHLHLVRFRMAAQGKRQGKPNFSLAEINILLDSVEAILPIGSDEWELVASEHNASANTDRTADSLKKKFRNLRKTQVRKLAVYQKSDFVLIDDQQMPTGDPRMPPHVKRAIIIDHKIKERCDMSGDDDAAFNEDLNQSSPLEETFEYDAVFSTVDMQGINRGDQQGSSPLLPDHLHRSNPAQSYSRTPNDRRTTKRGTDGTPLSLTDRAVRVKRQKHEVGEGGGQSSDMVMFAALLEEHRQQRVEDREARRLAMELRQQQHKSEMEASEQRFMLLFSKIFEKQNLS